MQRRASPLRITWLALGAIVVLQALFVALTPESPRARVVAWTPAATVLVVVALGTAGVARMVRHDASVWLAGSMIATLLALRQTVFPPHVEVPPRSEILVFFAIAGLLWLGAIPGVWLRPPDGGA